MRLFLTGVMALGFILPSVSTVSADEFGSRFRGKAPASLDGGTSSSVFVGDIEPAAGGDDIETLPALYESEFTTDTESVLNLDPSLDADAQEETPVLFPAE